MQATIPGNGSEWNHDKVCKAESLHLWITINCQKYLGTEPLMGKEAAV